MKVVRAELSNGTEKAKSSYKNPQGLFFCLPSVFLKSLFLIPAEQFLAKIFEGLVCR